MLHVQMKMEHSLVNAMLDMKEMDLLAMVFFVMCTQDSLQLTLVHFNFAAIEIQPNIRNSELSIVIISSTLGAVTFLLVIGIVVIMAYFYYYVRKSSTTKESNV